MFINLALGKNYDVSTAVNVGKWDMNDVFLNRGSDKDGEPRGMGFSSDGMKLFVVEIKMVLVSTKSINLI